ncbi:MAG: immunoglobulin domain-containing protein, partial [Verrucomicrobiota bacterium]
GALPVGGAVVARSFSFTAAGTCGGTLLATLQLQDGTNNLGTAAFSLMLGRPVAALVENFDGVTAPALPSGWSSSPAGVWVTTTAQRDTLPNSISAPDAGTITDYQLTSPLIPINSAISQLTFRNYYNTESSFDGGVLEVSINGAAFTDILTAGGSFTSGGYNGTISIKYSNPLAGRSAWTGNSGGFVTTMASLPASAAGGNVQLCWRLGTDSSVAGTGWYVDTVSVNGSTICCTDGPPSGLYITSQPQNQTLTSGSNAVFKVTAAGTLPISYQWKHNGTNIPSATSSSYQITNASESHLGGYTVLLTNSFGSVESSSAELSMYPFLAVPFKGAVTCWGRDTNLSVRVWGTGPMSYQWLKGGVKISGGTNDTLYLPQIQFSDAGMYSLIARSPLGSVTNSPGQVVVNPAGVTLGLYPGVTIEGVVGYRYLVQRSQDLSNTNSWTTMTNLTLQKAVQLWIDTNSNVALPNTPNSFYRVLPGQ